jgi:hypothetical protein
MTIEQVKTFDELAALRQEAYRSFLDNGHHLDDILVGLYRKETHFLFELFQNADDVKASDVEIKVTPNELVFWHNGKKDFDLKDVIGITGIGAGTKQNDTGTIGKFGIGFKSVFSVTKSPRIFSGEYNFEIKYFTVPSVSNRSSNIKDNGTTIILPFNAENKSKEEIYSKIIDAINKLDANAFMFLRYIENVRWEYGVVNGGLIKQLEISEPYYKMTAVSNKDNKIVEYLIFSRSLPEFSELKVSIAYKIEDDNGHIKIIPDYNTMLSVYFFTEMPTYLHFIVNAPFITSSTRESVDYTRKGNFELLEIIGSLYRESLGVLKKRNMLEIDFLDMLPIKKENCTSSPIYEILYNQTVLAFEEDSLLPCNDGSAANADKALLADGAELTNLLSDKDELENLFGGRNNWLDINITRDNKPGLFCFLNGVLKITNINFITFCRRIDKDFLLTKDDRWLKRFYLECGGRNDNQLKNVLISKPIIRTMTEDMIVPVIDNKPEAFFYSPSSPENKTVKTFFTEDNEENNPIRRFLVNIGLRTIDAVDVIRTVLLRKFSDEGSKNIKIDLFKNIYEMYTRSSNNEKESIIPLLKDKKIVLFKNIGHEEWRNPEKGYIRTESLSCLFDGFDDAFFVSEDMFFDSSQMDNISTFLIKLGVNRGLLRIRRNELDRDTKIYLRSGVNITWDTVENYDVQGLDFIIKHMNEERLRYLLDELTQKDDGFFMGKYTWGHGYSSGSKRFPAYFVDEILNERAWIIIKGERKRAVDIKKSEFINAFNIDSNSAFIRCLDFLPEAYDELPDELKTRLEIIKDIPREILNEFVEKYKESINVSMEDQVIEEEPGLNPVIPQRAVFDRTKSVVQDQEQENQEEDYPDGNGGKEKSGDDNYLIKKGLIIKTTDNKKLTLAQWSEREVIESLKHKYSLEGYSVNDTGTGFEAVKSGEKLVLINKNIDKNNKGYDLELRRNGEILKYIEVKGKENEEADFFNVHGKQWELARELCLKGRGDSYVVYYVSGAGKSSKKITIYENLYQLWLDQKIYADPVEIRLP